MLHRRHKRLVSNLAQKLRRLLEQEEAYGDELSIVEMSSFYSTIQTVAFAIARGNERKAEKFIMAVESEARAWQP